MNGLKRRVAACSVAAVLGACSVAFLALAGYLKMATLMAAETAALLAGGILLLLAFLVFCVLGRPAGLRRRGCGRRRGKDHPADELEALLAGHIDPALGGLVRRSPERALGAALVLGLVAGYSRSVRGALKDLYDSVARTDT